VGDRRRARCVVCKRHRDEVGELSWTGLCGECGTTIHNDNAIGISTKSGPYHRRRMRGYAIWLQRQALDDERKTA